MLESVAAFSCDIPSEDFGHFGLLLENIARKYSQPCLGRVFQILGLYVRIMAASWVAS